MDNRIAIGIIGAGIMGERLLNAIVQQAPETLRISGIWDPAHAAMGRISARFPQVRACADAATVMAASDCVYIASPPASHLVHARAALAADRTIFSEKPLAVDVADARRFVAQAGGRAAVNFPFASSPGVASLKEWLANGEIGQPARIRIEVAFASWPRSWQVDAADGWTSRRKAASRVRSFRISCFSATG